MNLARLASIATSGISLDTETHAIRQGLLVPRVVCGSLGWLDSGKIVGAILDRIEVGQIFLEALREGRVISGANISFDLAVIARLLAEQGIDVMPLIFAAFENDQFYDVQISEALNAIADGMLGKDPRTGGPLLNPETGRRGRYSLSTCVSLNLDREDAKANDEFRLVYGKFDGVPMAKWPPAAIQYPIDDGINNHEVTLAQVGAWPRVVREHRWSPPADGVTAVCLDCGTTSLGQPCRVRRRHRNLHEVSLQTATAFSMHLGAAWGFHVNQQSVDIVERHALRNRERGIVPFTEAGLVRPDGTENRSDLKRRIAVAYGAQERCEICHGTGKVVSPAAPKIRCKTCKATGRITSGIAAVLCPDCGGAGKIPSPKALINCFRLAEDGETRLRTCDGTGLNIDDVPRSDKEGVSYGKDVLHESGEEFLMSYGDFQEDAKDLNVYIPFLRRGREPIAGHGPACPALEGDPCECPGPYRDIPLTLRPNVLLDTGRTSYDGVIQLFKRQPGFVDEETGEWVPSLRECIEARPGHVLGSIDYDSGELVTHAQSCLWIVGMSRLAEALVAGKKIHNALGATMIGKTYDDFELQMKSSDPAAKRVAKGARQAAKPGNFGFPGGMGPVKMVLQQRKQGPDTPHPNGPNWVLDEGKLVRGYKGLRFCILMDGADACGIEKLRVWNDEPISPTCAHCIKCAQRLRDSWYQQWPENRAYFKFINDCLNRGQVITSGMLRRWPHLAEVFYAGQQLAPGEIMQHFSGRIRGGVEYSSAANGFFQGLLADIAKAALRRIVRECYDKTVRVPSMAHANSVVSKYAGGVSPLVGSRIIVFQHDEVIPESPESVAHDAFRRISEIMVEEEMHYCPDMVPACKAPPAMMRRWLKTAEPKYLRGGDKPADDNDPLIPWEPKVAA